VLEAQQRQAEIDQAIAGLGELRRRRPFRAAFHQIDAGQRRITPAFAGAIRPRALL
jgi:hypothetical protein